MSKQPSQSTAKKSSSVRTSPKSALTSSSKGTSRKKKGELWVVKVGSGLLADKKGGVNHSFIASIAEQVADLQSSGKQVILVSSGAISSGMTVLGQKKRPTDLAQLQACCTIGQPRLMAAYQEAFEKHGLLTAQILLTYWDLDSRKLYQNTEQTMQHLLAMGNCIPICNENDALSFEEIKFGDNDQLSGHVALLAKADRLIILSTIPGLMSQPDGTGRLIRQVKKIDQRIESFAGNTQSQRSVGGMRSKIETAKLMLESEIPMVIADGMEKDVLRKLAAGKRVGTLFGNG